MKDEKITLGTTTKKTPSTIMAAATTIAPLLASAAMILGIQKQTSQQTIERKEIMNKKIAYLYQEKTTNITKLIGSLLLLKIMWQ